MFFENVYVESPPCLAALKASSNDADNPARWVVFSSMVYPMILSHLHVSQKQKHHFCQIKVIFRKNKISISLALFGATQSFWYLGLCTARDLFISRVFHARRGDGGGP